MSSITSYLLQIRNSVYGRDMRSSIYNAIAEAFGQNGTYTDQVIRTGGTLTDNKTKVEFFIPLLNTFDPSKNVDRLCAFQVVLVIVHTCYCQVIFSNRDQDCDQIPCVNMFSQIQKVLPKFYGLHTQ